MTPAAPPLERACLGDPASTAHGSAVQPGPGGRRTDGITVTSVQRGDPDGGRSRLVRKEVLTVLP